MKMIIFIVIIQIIQFSINYDSYTLTIDRIFKLSVSRELIFNDCGNKNVRNFHYRGLITNIKDILHIYKEDANIDPSKLENLKIQKYPAVLIENGFLLKYIPYFPESTIFLIDYNLGEIDSYKNEKYCIFRYRSLIYENNPFSYIIISQDIKIKLLYYIIILFVTLILFICFFTILYSIHSCISNYNRIFLNYFANLNIIMTLISISTCIFFKFCILFSLIYYLYKSYLFIHLYFFLTGYSIINFDFNVRKQLQNYTYDLFAVETITTIIFAYIIYFIPSLDNFYLFFTRNMIERVIILLIVFKQFKDKYIKLYKQFRLEKRLRSILTIGYKLKLILYIKVFIFSFLYSIAFIAFYLIIIIYRLNTYTEGFHYIYYINILLEIFFTIVQTIIFFPSKVSIFYFSPVNFDYDSLKFVAQIKEINEEYLDTTLLSKRLMIRYSKNEYPLVFIGPYAKTDGLFSNIHLGMVAKK